MEFSNRQWMISLLCGLVLVVTVTNGEEEAEKEVEMKLYQASVADWDSTGRAKYREIVAEEATAHCGDNKQDCDGQQPTFKVSGYEEVSVERVKAYLEVKYSMKFPNEEKYLTKNTLKAITIKAAAKFKDQTDMTIVDVEGESQPLAPKTTLNIAISCTAIVIIIGLVIALLIMQHKCGGKKSHKDHKREPNVTNA